MYRRYYPKQRQKIKSTSVMAYHGLTQTGVDLTQSELLKPEELIKLDEAARISGFSVSYLREIAQRGRLWAIKKNRSWLTTLAAIEEYKRNRYLEVKKF